MSATVSKVLTCEGHYVRFEFCSDGERCWISQGIEQLNEEYEIDLTYGYGKILSNKDAMSEMDQLFKLGYQSLC